MSTSATNSGSTRRAGAWRIAPFLIGAGGLVAGFVVASGISFDGPLKGRSTLIGASPDIAVDKISRVGFDQGSVRPIRHDARTAQVGRAPEPLQRVPGIGERFRVTDADGHPTELEVVSTAPLEIELDPAGAKTGGVPGAQVVLVTLKVVGEHAEAEPRLVRMILDVPHDHPVGLAPTVLRRKAT